MTDHKTLNTVFHAAFRRTLERFDRALGDFPDGSKSRADQGRGYTWASMASTAGRWRRRIGVITRASASEVATGLLTRPPARTS